MKFTKIKKGFELLSAMYFPSTKQKNRKLWLLDDGDKILRLNHNLTPDSIVFDLGGYKEQWSSDVFSKYLCNIHIFEPHPDYYKYIVNRFRLNNKIQCFDYGLAEKTMILPLSNSANGSSTYKKDAVMFDAKLVKASDYFKEHSIHQIDLVKINIEGGEYDLLEHLISSDLIKNIDNIQVQFHDFVPDAKNRMKNIQNKLSSTHTLTYQYEFIWENWKINK